MRRRGGYGGPAPEEITERIYRKTAEIAEYRIVEGTVDIDQLGSSRLGDTEVVVFDPLDDYSALMQQIFDFPKLRKFLASGFRMCFDAMNGVTGPFAKHIFLDLLGAPEGSVIRSTPLEDFGGEHPDPNLTYAAELVAKLAGDDAPDFGAACDGDGDRNLILGRKCFVSPGDSLAVIAELAPAAIPAYKDGLAGVARSMPTSMAADRVAAALGIPCFETPTGWKFFGSLLDAGKITICGEESFGTGSNHVREKDGLWAVLAWLSILAHTGKSVDQVLRDHWSKFGRSYYQRYDYEGVSAEGANAMFADLRAKLGSLAGTPLAGSRIARADDFSYTDPVNGATASNQGTRIFLEDGSRVILRLSGTGTEGATLRAYFESYSKDNIAQDADAMIRPLAQAVSTLLDLEGRLGRNRLADVRHAIVRAAHLVQGHAQEVQHIGVAGGGLQQAAVELGRALELLLAVHAHGHLQGLVEGDFRFGAGGVLHGVVSRGGVRLPRCTRRRPWPGDRQPPC